MEFPDPNNSTCDFLEKHTFHVRILIVWILSRSERVELVSECTLDDFDWKNALIVGHPHYTYDQRPCTRIRFVHCVRSDGCNDAITAHYCGPVARVVFNSLCVASSARCLCVCVLAFAYNRRCIERNVQLVLRDRLLSIHVRSYIVLYYVLCINGRHILLDAGMLENVYATED